MQSFSELAEAATTRRRAALVEHLDAEVESDPENVTMAITSLLLLCGMTISDIKVGGSRPKTPRQWRVCVTQFVFLCVVQAFLDDTSMETLRIHWYMLSVSYKEDGDAGALDWVRVTLAEM